MVVISPATRADAPAIAELLAELDQFYGDATPEPAESRIAQIERVLFAAVPQAYVLLARQDEQVIGLASYSYLWPAAGTTASLYLKELYVRQTEQRRGVGRALMDRLRAIATEHGCSRVEWTTDADNPGAQQFYEALGYEPHPKIFYRAVIAEQ